MFVVSVLFASSHKEEGKSERINKSGAGTEPQRLVHSPEKKNLMLGQSSRKIRNSSQRVTYTAHRRMQESGSSCCLNENSIAI